MRRSPRNAGRAHTTDDIPAGPINLSNFGWPTVVAVVVVATTALALDFAAFRAAELVKSNGRREPTTASQQEQQRDGEQQVANGGRGDGSDAPQVSARPRRSSAASDAAESRVRRNRACVLAVWILAAFVCHRWVRVGHGVKSMHKKEA